MQSVLSKLSEEETLALTKVQEACGDSFVGGIVYNNYDRDENTGISLAVRSDAPVTAELISGNMFQYVAVVPLDPKRNPHITDDSYFTDKREALGAAVPQYAECPPSLSLRNPLNGNDRKVTGVELGQYGGRVGIYKSIDDVDGEDTHYYLVAVGGAEHASRELQQHVDEEINAIDKWHSDNKYCNAHFHDSAEQNYVRHVAQSNVRRMLYEAADAFEVAPETTLYYNVDIDVNRESYPSQVIADHMQQIAGLYESHTNGGDPALHVYKGVIPPHELRQNRPFYVLEGPADPIHVFDMGDACMIHGAPACTGRTKPLPNNVKDVKIDVAVAADYEKRCKKVFWEGDGIHAEVAPDAYHRIQNKTDRSFLEKLESWGWDKNNNTHERMYPVCVKISNPFLLRK